MDLSLFFPIWAELSPTQQEMLRNAAIPMTVPKGSLVHDSSADCMGLLLICSGQLRSYILSDEGRELTLYRLFELDTCLFSAACAMPNVQFDMMIQAEKETELLVIPPYIYRAILKESAPMANYINELLSSRFSEVMWRMEQIMWKSFDKRLAAFLLEESTLENSPDLKLTHDTIANHLGTAREVVTRMLRYFQVEGYVSLSRGTVHIRDEAALRRLDSR